LRTRNCISQEGLSVPHLDLLDERLDERPLFRQSTFGEHPPQIVHNGARSRRDPPGRLLRWLPGPRVPLSWSGGLAFRKGGRLVRPSPVSPSEC
jgi:hypothetical protein